MSRETRLNDSGRVLDDASRLRRLKKSIEALEMDNFQEEPHADLVMSKKAPKFQETLDGSRPSSKKKKVRSTEYYKKYRRTIGQLIEEDLMATGEESLYTEIESCPPKVPCQHYCNVCGFQAPYTCVTCGLYFCNTRCLKTHKDTRCLKWTA